jgi:hypothetical protein
MGKTPFFLKKSVDSVDPKAAKISNLPCFSNGVWKTSTLRTDLRQQWRVSADF